MNTPIRATKPVIFLAFANSSVSPLPNLAAEYHRLETILRQAEQKGLYEFVVAPYATVDDILNTFQDERYRGRIALFHYAGHAHSYELLLQDAAGQPAVADGGGLASFLGHQSGLQLVFLNACATQPQVQGLLGAGVAVVIATSQAIDDQVATDFAVRCYQFLTDGDAVDVAFEKAQAAVQMQRGSNLRSYAVSDENDVGTDRWPWALYQCAEAIGADRWNLSDAATRDLLPFEPETVLIPGGPFRMGSNPGEGIPTYETPQHMVDLPVYRIGKYPVTNRQYSEYIRQNKQQDVPVQAGWFLREPPTDKLDHPAIGISWHDSVAYCTWLSGMTGRHYRLSTEAEWEKAARGGDGQRYPWGDIWVDGRCNVSNHETTPVDNFPDGASPAGCLDMLGNVQEWTCTLWLSRPQTPVFAYPYDAHDGREVGAAAELLPGARLVHRGGSFKSRAEDLRCALRGHADPASKIAWRGLRVVLDP